MAMHLAFHKTSQPMVWGGNEKVSAETLDGLVLILLRKTILDPVETTDVESKKVKTSVYKALVVHHVGIKDWFGDCPEMTGGDFTILYNHVLDQLRKHAFSSNLSRILRMRDARFSPSAGMRAPTTSRDAFAMMVSCAPPRYPRCSHCASRTTPRHPRS